jgi:hypothetical protein
VPESQAGAARSVAVSLRRLPRWLDGFAERHGPWRQDPAVEAGAGTWPLRAADGARATVHVPAWLVDVGGGVGPGGDAGPDVVALAALRPPFGAVLIRRAGYAVGLFAGAELVERKVGSRHIHGRTAAGGWSQQRYARRRANQADEIVEACAGAADRILDGGPSTSGAQSAGGGSGREEPSRSADPAGAGKRTIAVPAQFLVTGGDRPLVAAVLAEVAPAIAALPVVAHLGIGTPDAAVLAGVPDRVLAVRIEIHDS